jgi:hypothetical protein
MTIGKLTSPNIIYHLSNVSSKIRYLSITRGGKQYKMVNTIMNSGLLRTLVTTKLSIADEYR